MKLKVYVGISLLVVTAIVIGLRAHYISRNVGRPLIPSTKAGEPAALPVVSPSERTQGPFNPVKMVTVSAQAKSLPVPDRVRPAWSDIQSIIDGKEDGWKRLDAVARLPAKLSDSDWEVLRDFLVNKDPLDNEQLGQVLKNGVMDALCAMSPPPVGLGEALTQIYHDNGQNEVLRDYAVQHLAAYAEQLQERNDQASIEERREVQDTLWEALGETSDSVAGTGLLALKRLHEEGVQIDENRLGMEASKLAANSVGGELTHITAYQVCAQLNVQSALPVIEAAAQHSPTVSAQISAIGALGLLGNAADIPFLEKLLQSNEERLKPAVRHALEQITVQRNRTIGTQIVNRK